MELQLVYDFISFQNDLGELLYASLACLIVLLQFCNVFVLLLYAPLEVVNVLLLEPRLNILLVMV